MLVFEDYADRRLFCFKTIRIRVFYFAPVAEKLDFSLKVVKKAKDKTGILCKIYSIYSIYLRRSKNYAFQKIKMKIGKFPSNALLKQKNKKCLVQV